MKKVFPNEILLGEVERLLKEGTSVTLRTKGNSMLPFIVGGRDSVVIVKYDSIPKNGDIALAHLTNNVYVLHRVIFVGDDGKVILMGDGNLRGTETCSVDDICGKVVVIIRNGKNIDPYSQYEMLLSRVWRKILPCRRILLALYRRLFIRL